MRVENLLERRRARRRQQAPRNPPPPVHVQFQPTFSFTRTPAVHVASTVQSRLSGLLEEREAGDVQVSLTDRTATLTGSVNSEYLRRLLEHMVGIEPGVSAVRNLITVEEPVSAPPLSRAQ